MTVKSYTPLGVELTIDEISEQERIICDACDFAVLEDEYLPCSDCDASWCLYCWQDWNWRCKGCGKVHESVKARTQ